MCTVPEKFRHFAAKVKGGIPWQIRIDVFGGARFLAKKKGKCISRRVFLEKCVFSQQGKVRILAFLLSVLLFLHLFPTLLASFSFCGVCVAHCSTSCPHVHYFPPCSFFGVATTCVSVFADVRYNLFLPVGARPPLLHSKFISSYRETHLRTYILGGYVFVQKKGGIPSQIWTTTFSGSTFSGRTAFVCENPPEKRAPVWGNRLRVYSKVGPNRNSTTQFRGVELDRKEA